MEVNNPKLEDFELDLSMRESDVLPGIEIPSGCIYENYETAFGVIDNILKINNSDVEKYKMLIFTKQQIEYDIFNTPKNNIEDESLNHPIFQEVRSPYQLLIDSKITIELIISKYHNTGKIEPLNFAENNVIKRPNSEYNLTNYNREELILFLRIMKEAELLRINEDASKFGGEISGFSKVQIMKLLKQAFDISKENPDKIDKLYLDIYSMYKVVKNWKEKIDKI